MSKSKDKFSIIAHRGGPAGEFTENSLEAFENVLKSDCDAIETDVWLSNDKLVIAHNEPVEENEYLELSELLKLISGKKDLYLDIKHEDSAIATFGMVQSDYSEYFDTVIFGSFEKEALRIVRKKSASARIGLAYRGIDNDFIDLAEELGAESVSFNWLRVFPNYFNIKQSREATNLKHYAYTVNDKYLARLMKSLGMSGIFTDFPDKFTE